MASCRTVEALPPNNLVQIRIARHLYRQNRIICTRCRSGHVYDKDYSQIECHTHNRRILRTSSSCSRGADRVVRVSVCIIRDRTRNSMRPRLNDCSSCCSHVAAFKANEHRHEAQDDSETHGRSSAFTHKAQIMRNMLTRLEYWI